MLVFVVAITTNIDTAFVANASCHLLAVIAAVLVTAATVVLVAIVVIVACISYSCSMIDRVDKARDLFPGTCDYD